MNKQRLLNCIKADISFQMKHGFYAVYIIVCIAYIIILSFIPPAGQKYVLPIMIYSDPAGLGLFFIGGMVLLEKEQGVLALLYITPLKVYEYIMSKVLTLGLISTLAGLFISLASYGREVNYIMLAVSIFLSSVFYTLIGFLIAARSKSVNVYLVKMLPAIIVFILPCLTFISNNVVPQIVNSLILLVPSAGGLKLILGSYNDIPFMDTIISFLGLVIFNVFLIKKIARVLTDKIILNS